MTAVLALFGGFDQQPRRMLSRLLLVPELLDATTIAPLPGLRRQTETYAPKALGYAVFAVPGRSAMR